MTPKIVCFPFVGDSVGGSHISALELAGGLDRHRYVPLVLLHQRGPLADFLEAKGTDFTLLSEPVTIVQNLGLFRQMQQMWNCSGALSAVLKKHRVSIVHTNDLRMHMTWLVAASRARCKMIWHQRTAENSRRTAVYSALASRVLTISGYCKKSFAWFMASRARAVPDPVNVVPDERARNKCREQLLRTAKLPESGRIVSFVANFTEQKRPWVFVDMASLVAKAHEGPVAFFLFGQMREPVAVRVRQKIAALGLENAVFCMGQQHPVEPWIAASDVMVAPAVNEGLGRVLIEAQLLGVPVVATRDGGHCEIIEHGVNGLLAHIDDADDFAAQTCTLLEDADKRQAIIETARVGATQRFSVQNHCATVEGIYDSIT